MPTGPLLNQLTGTFFFITDEIEIQLENQLTSPMFISGQSIDLMGER
ncbi:hypothetical protein GCM10007941_10140 [Amphritea balenae]|nr:hypothetical protein GCM10007941_10140 [Amphritea balenae]